MMKNAIKNIFAREALRSRAKLFAMSGGISVRKRTGRQGLEPRAMRPKIIAPNGGQQEVHLDFPFFTLDELDRPLMTAQPNLADIQCPSLTASSPSIATSARFAVERTLAKTEETVEQNPDFPFFSHKELGRPFKIAQPNLFDIQSPSLTTSISSIASSAKFTAE